MGSSHVRQLGFERDRHRDHDALTLTAAELMRVEANPRFGVLECRHASAARAPSAPTPPASGVPRRRRNTSAICETDFSRKTGFSELSGSWKTIAISVPHSSRTRLTSLQATVPSRGSRIRATDDRSTGFGSRGHDRLGGHRLAGAGLSKDGDRLACPHIEAHAVDGAYDAGRRRELHLQILNTDQQAPRIGAEDVGARHQALRRLGSKRSRRASPRTPVAGRDRERDPGQSRDPPRGREIRGAVVDRAAGLGMPRGTPTPRKESAASSRTTWPNSTVATTRIGATHPGSSVRKIEVAAAGPQGASRFDVFPGSAASAPDCA